MSLSVDTGMSKPPIRRRRVFYIPGFDPVPARRYREIYRAEGARQASLSGYELSITARLGSGGAAWLVDAKIEGQTVRSHVEVLGWADIVKRSMDGGVFRSYLYLLHTAWIYIGSGAVFRLFSLRKGPVIAGLYPVAMLTAQLAMALAVACAIGWVLVALTHPVLAVVSLLVISPILGWFKSRDSQLLAHYLMQDYAFTCRLRGAYSPDLEERICVFVANVAEAIASLEREEAVLEDGSDEVLLVGHSSGAHIAVSVVAELLRNGKIRPDGPSLSLLTLGQSIPMVSILPNATRLRADLALVSRSPDLTWIDVSAPGDGAAFALCDPVSVSGLKSDGKRWPLVLSCAFSRNLSSETWRSLKWRFFRLHFQYLCAFDGLKGRRDEYDYFRITAGPQRLGDRLGRRRPSPARIERAIASFRTITEDEYQFYSPAGNERVTPLVSEEPTKRTKTAKNGAATV